MEITIRVEGATPEEIARGIAAAKAVFQRARVPPEDAAFGRANVEYWDDCGFQGPIRDEDFDLHEVWDNADTAALEACCVGWGADRKPTHARLELVYPTAVFAIWTGGKL